MIKIKRPGLGFYFTAGSLIFTAAALAMFFRTYDVFGYAINRWALFMTLLSVWCLLFRTMNTLFAGEKPFWASYVHVLVSLLLVLSLLLVIKPCLSPIGIYFTVHNMGDVETNAVGVPASIITAACYLAAVVCNLIAGFSSSERKKAVKS